MFEVFIVRLYNMDSARAGVLKFRIYFQHFYTKPYLNSSNSTAILQQRNLLKLILMMADMPLCQAPPYRQPHNTHGFSLEAQKHQR